MQGCVKGLLPPSAAKDYFERGCVKRFFTALRAELCFERHVIFTISRREIVKMTCLTKYNLARSAEKILFTQPRIPYKILRGEAADTRGK
jgi:hypothetical protein